jgi:hypothetical protein
VQLGAGQGQRRDRHVHPGQVRGRDRRQEQRVARRLQHRVAADQAEQRGERRRHVAPLAGADGSQQAYHTGSLPQAAAAHGLRQAERER